MFGASAPFGSIAKAFQSQLFTWAVSTEILLEYNEVIEREVGSKAAAATMRFLEVASALWGTVKLVSPTFRFGLIVDDPDDNKFMDCAIVAEANYIVTKDRHFRVIAGSGFKPQAVSPEDFIRQCLQIAP